MTDQENALVLDDRSEPALHDARFAELTKRVWEGPARCGYPYCSCGIMAANRQWREPLRAWKSTFKSWIQTPARKGFLQVSIFFYPDGVWGEIGCADRLRESILRQPAATPPF